MKENLDKVFFPSEILHKYCLPTICIAPKFWALYSSLCRSCGILHTDWKFEKKGISELGNFGVFTCLITNCQQKMLFQVFKFCTKMFWNKMVLFICYLIFKLPKKGQSIIFSCGGSIWWVYFGGSMNGAITWKIIMLTQFERFKSVSFWQQYFW